MTCDCSYWEQTEYEGIWRCHKCKNEVNTHEHWDAHPVDDLGWMYCPYCGRKMNMSKPREQEDPNEQW